jgi:hypothetical protein
LKLESQNSVGNSLNKFNSNHHIKTAKNRKTEARRADAARVTVTKKEDEENCASGVKGPLKRVKSARKKHARAGRAVEGKNRGKIAIEGETGACVRAAQKNSRN